MTPDNVQALKPRLSLIEGHGQKVLTVPIARVERCGLCEDGKTWMALVTLLDGRIVGVTLCPGSPITACEVETCEAL